MACRRQAIRTDDALWAYLVATQPYYPPAITSRYWAIQAHPTGPEFSFLGKLKSHRPFIRFVVQCRFAHRKTIREGRRSWPRS